MNWRLSRAGWRLLPGAIALGLVMGSINFGWIKPLEQVAYSALFRLRGERQWDDRLVLVTIDDDSIKQLGRFPWKRTQYVKLIDRLTEADAGVIAIDVLFSELTPEDAAFAAAIARSNRVVLTQAEGKGGLPLLPVPQLEAATVASGHIRIQSDEDGIARSIEPQFRQVWAFGIAATLTYSMLREAIALPDFSQRIWLNWVGQADAAPQYSFARVIRGEIPDSAFRDKLVLVGVTATAIDAHPTPFDRNPAASGVHVQATLINNLLQSNLLTPIQPPFVLLLLISAIGSLSFSLLLSYWRTEIQLAIATVAVAGWVGTSLALLNANYLPSILPPIGLITISTIATVLIERSRIHRNLEQQIKQIQQRYHIESEPQDAENLAQFASMQELTRLTTLVDQLGRSQATQATIVHCLPIALVACDLEGRVWFCNAIAASMLNIQAGRCLEPILVPNWINPEQWQEVLQHPHRIATEQLRQERWFRLQIEPLEIRADGILMTLEDITIYKTIELNLDDQVEELQQLSELKDEYLSTVSHELRAPLTNMKMALQLFRIAKTESQREKYIKILNAECDRESELVNTLLDLQRLESGRQLIDVTPIDLETWLPELLEPFFRRTESRQQTLELEISPALPVLHSDHAALERILIELINNACKYTPPTEHIIVFADWIAPHVELSIKNSGVEIPPEARSRIFERFYRVPNADPWKQGGSGLGLALVQKLVESLQGTIGVSSDQGWTRFTVQLPIQPGKTYQ
ncbi:CHASE2 domain-containing protein [Leptolyngbya sp. DQ-M1]|uniref:CHASE2 domain-containing protein n=1 Tax=Leptolyngbya sp. DQ-M1 TaxID=2933920 RepID=UPI00329845A3